MNTIIPVGYSPAPAQRRITVGAFKDRLGLPLVVGLSVSSHPLCVGSREYLYDRAWIDLDRADLRSTLLALVALQLPSPVAGVPGSGPLTAQDVARVLDVDPSADELP